MAELRTRAAAYSLWTEFPPPNPLSKLKIMSSAVRVEGLSHRYGERTALNAVTFEVGHSEIFGLLGPNGSGKTTLFRVLSTLMIPTSGGASILGIDVVKNANEVRRLMGVVFQAKSIDTKLTAAENLMHQGHLYGLRGTPLKKRMQEMLVRVGLEERADELVETFSGGMQRRIELAKGLLHRPALLLLDEPTTGLDPGARRDLWQYLKMLRNEENVTVIVTTHLMEEAERCDRLAILNDGNLVAVGTPAELKSRIGGDVVVIEADDPGSLALRIANRFGTTASVVEGKIRFEKEHGSQLMTELTSMFPEIHSVSVSRPNLEDVFIQLTGHRFWTDKEKEHAHV